MSMYMKDLRDIAGQGWPVLDDIADEIEDTERAYALLFKDHELLCSPFGWCRNCQKATEHEIRKPDLCCKECDFIAFTYHNKPRKD